MSAKIIDGKKVAQDIQLEIKNEAARLSSTYHIVPGLAAVLVGDNPASHIYVRMKRRACQEAGMFSDELRFPASLSEKDLLTAVEGLNRRKDIHGILVQLPLPPHISTPAVLEAVDPLKDVDCFHPFNVGKLLSGEPFFAPCTPLGVQELLRRSGIETKGKHVVILGRSNIVGKPLAALLLAKGKGSDATVTVCHSQSQDIPSITRQADILVAAMGRARFVKAEMVKSGAVVVDVGINRIADPEAPNGMRLVGDVDFDAVREKASAITPVPGGVGPMTIAMLLFNTLKAAKCSAAK